MQGNFIHKGIIMKKCEYGWGVFTENFIPKDTLIERCIMCRLVNVDGNENPHLYTWSDDRKTWAAGSGLSPFYNYSENPNIQKKGDLPNDILEIYALRDIKAGEQLCNTYFSKEWRKCFQNF